MTTQTLPQAQAHSHFAKQKELRQTLRFHLHWLSCFSSSIAQAFQPNISVAENEDPIKEIPKIH
jgi:hypothetical protein